MQRRTWDAHTKTKSARQGLQGRSVAESCHEYQMSQSLYDQWRDPFLAHAANAFERHQHTREKTRLERENASLKKLVGAVLLE